ncbi:hypothetical protein B0H66DRAFT_14522 [Apodospora peruviana]|uniref:Uncharacterized protein n=1 Tax=Apodospora peruviana TaxID=516989 RepID=A0AAE0IQE7_9PEZI|nr:hypothetical protein B0H66DRAFT_14522 [Apodospora peruviana]
MREAVNDRVTTYWMMMTLLFNHGCLGLGVELRNDTVIGYNVITFLSPPLPVVWVGEWAMVYHWSNEIMVVLVSA